MNITPWTRKAVDPFDDFFNLDSPNWGYSLLPVLDRGLGSTKKGFFPAVDVSADEQQVTVKVDIPGLKKEEIQLSAEGSVLTITGERKFEEEKKEKNYRRLERSYGRFERSIDVGTTIDQSKVRPKYHNGVLKITIPRTDDPIKKQIQIEG